MIWKYFGNAFWKWRSASNQPQTFEQQCQLCKCDYVCSFYLVRMIRPTSSLVQASGKRWSPHCCLRLYMKSRTVSLRRTLWLTSEHSMMLDSYWRMVVMNPGQIVSLHTDLDRLQCSITFQQKVNGTQHKCFKTCAGGCWTDHQGCSNDVRSAACLVSSEFYNTK